MGALAQNNRCRLICALTSGRCASYHRSILDTPPIKLPPVPAEPVPILIGCPSDAALHRAARIHAGSADAYTPDEFTRLEALGVDEVYIGFSAPYAPGRGPQSLEDKLALLRSFAGPGDREGAPMNRSRSLDAFRRRRVAVPAAPTKDAQFHDHRRHDARTSTW
jgi:hypothetical protein